MEKCVSLLMGNGDDSAIYNYLGISLMTVVIAVSVACGIIAFILYKKFTIDRKYLKIEATAVRKEEKTPKQPKTYNYAGKSITITYEYEIAGQKKTFVEDIAAKNKINAEDAKKMVYVDPNHPKNGRVPDFEIKNYYMQGVLYAIITFAVVGALCLIFAYNNC